MVNHWWQVPLYVSARGLSTSLMHAGDRGLEIEFDFLHHVLELRTTSSEVRQIALEPRTVASFYAEVRRVLDELGIEVHLLGRPVEVAVAIPFAEDDEHRAYDRDAAARFWQALVLSHRTLSKFRARFIGKASPVHFFWGATDLAATRFSGRTAPAHPGGVPNCPDWVQQKAYSHEVSSCGFWPGGSEEGSFRLRLSRAKGLLCLAGHSGGGVLRQRPLRVLAALPHRAGGRRARADAAVVLPEHLRGRGGARRLGPGLARDKRTAMSRLPCPHLGTAAPVVTPSSTGCEDCERTGGEWVHLRVCMTCGHVGCCDSSPNRHATAHYHANPDHPIIRSYEPGEDWWWCYPDELMFEVEGAPLAPSHP
jgi:hypothetical protein